MGRAPSSRLVTAAGAIPAAQVIRTRTSTTRKAHNVYLGTEHLLPAQGLYGRGTGWQRGIA